MEENQETKEPLSVMSVGLRYGLILSAVSIAYSTILMALGTSTFEQDWKAYMSIVFTIAAVVLAHKYYKENGDGFMSFGQGFGLAFVAVVVSIIVSGIFTYIYVNFIDPTVMDVLWDQTAEKMQAQGQSDEAIEMGLGIAKNFFWVFFALGGMFWGSVIGLVVTIFTQKKRPEMTF